MNNVAGVGLKNISQRGHIYSNVVVVLDRNLKNNAAKKCPKTFALITEPTEASFISESFIWKPFATSY